MHALPEPAARRRPDRIELADPSAGTANARGAAGKHVWRGAAPAAPAIRTGRPRPGHAGRQRHGAGRNGARCTVRPAAALSRRHGGRAAAAAGGADVGPCGGAAARHRAGPAAGLPGACDRLGRCPRRAAVGRPLRPGRLHRLCAALHARHRAGRAHGGDLPVLRAGAGGGGPAGRGRRSGPAAQPDADGRPDRRPHPSQPGEPLRHRGAAGLVRD